jgi:hypothetical protein
MAARTSNPRGGKNAKPKINKKAQPNMSQDRACAITRIFD